MNTVKALLRWTEQYTNTDMLYVAKGTFWMTVLRFFTVGIGLCLSIIYANFVDPTILGIFKYVASAIAVLSITSMPYIENSYSQSVARGNEGGIREGARTRMKWSTIGSALALVMALYYGINENIPISVSFLIAGVLLPFSESFSLYKSLFHGRKDFRRLALYSSIEQVSATSLVILCAFIYPHVIALTIAYFAGWAVTRAIIYIWVIRTQKINSDVEPTTISFGKKLTVIHAIPYVAQHVDRILIFHLIGPIGLAGYNFAVVIPDQIKSYFKQVQGIAVPLFATAHASGIRREIPRKSIFLGLILLAATVAYFFAAPLFFLILFPKYLEFVVFSQLYALTILFSGALLPIYALQAKEKTGHLYVYNLVKSSIQICAACVFLFLFGLWGLIVSRIITDLTALILALFLVRKISD